MDARESRDAQENETAEKETVSLGLFSNRLPGRPRITRIVQYGMAPATASGYRPGGRRYAERLGA